MLTDILLGGLIQLSHQVLRQPNCFILKSHLDTITAILGLIEDDLGLGFWKSIGFRQMISICEPIALVSRHIHAIIPLRIKIIEIIY